LLNAYHLPQAAVGYDEVVGLELNADDVAARETWALFLAVSYALRPDVPVPWEWFAAVCDTEGEARDLEYRTNARRR
jgi:hypothetical protein